MARNREHTHPTQGDKDMANTPPRADMVTNDRGWTEMHEDLAAYIKSETGYSADVTTIRLAFALRNDYRKTERYAKLRADREAAREAEQKAKEEARAQREKERAEKAAAKEKAAAEKKKAKAKS